MLNGVTCQGVGYHGGYNGNPQRNVQSVLMNGYLYMVSYDKTKVYKINIDNAADIKEIPLGSASAYSCNDDYYRSGSMWLANLGDWIVGSDFRINTEDKVFRKANSAPWTYTSAPLFQYGPYLFSFGGYYANSTRQNLFLWTPYLANLGDWIVGSDFRINTEDKVFRKANSAQWTYTSTPLFQYGPYFFSFGGYYANSTRQNLFLWTPYLATINNLETSVIKTADKTMKITYTIQEE